VLPSADLAQARAVMAAAPCHVVLPAGCGKTQAVASVAATAAQDGRRVLLLTHTHAGVDALRVRLRHLGVPPDARNLATIAAWTARLVQSYPGAARSDGREGATWSEVCAAAARALRNRHIAGMLAASYDVIVVDEYQDCTCAQHDVVLALNAIRPVIAFGDPLQAIYTFGDEKLVDWRQMEPLRPLSLPCVGWRWRGVNERLGAYLLDVRRSLLAGKAVDLRHPAVRWVDASPQATRRALWASVNVPGTVTVIARFDQQCEKIAKSLSGRFDVMEDIEGTRLLETARLVDASDGVRAAGAVLGLAKASMAKLPATLTTKLGPLQTGRFPRFQADTSAAPALRSLQHFADAGDPAALLTTLDALDGLGATLCRQEAWRDFRRSAVAWEQGAASLTEAVRSVRHRSRILGRRLATRSVSRTVLIKGQEFDHCIVTSPETMTACELYVAMTRGSRTLTVVSPTPMLEPSAG